MYWSPIDWDLTAITFQLLLLECQNVMGKKIPIAFPGMHYIRVCNAMVGCIVIKYIKEIFDCQGQRISSMIYTEYGLKQIIDIVLYGAL